MKFLVNLFRRGKQERELDEELRFYVDELAETKVREGMTPDEAMRAAKIQFGGIEQVKEQVRDARSGAWLDSILQDLRYAVRGLRNNAGFATVIVLSLAAGIGANSALFSVINAVMLRPLPVSHPEQLYSLNVSGQIWRSSGFFSYPLFEEMRDRARQNGDELAAISRIARVRVNSVREAPPPMVYYAIRQAMVYGYSLEVRVIGEPAARIPDIRRAIMSIDRSLPVDDITTLSAQVNDDLRQDWLIFWLTSIMGALALGLGCFGLYGVTSYTVARRTGELGIGMALGASRSTVFGMVFRESLLMIAGGLAVGLPFVLAASRLVAGMLFGVKVNDPAPVCIAALALAAATLLATYAPARRAARIEPITALRYE